MADGSKRHEAINLSGDTKRDAFLAVQFNALRQEIELQITERRKVEAQTFIGLAAIYAWVFTSTSQMTGFYLTMSLVVPFVFSVLGFLRWVGIMSRIMVLGAYNHSIEKAIIGETGGWEHFLAYIRQTRPFVGRLEGIAEFLAWSLVIIATALVLLISIVNVG